MGLVLKVVDLSTALLESCLCICSCARVRCKESVCAREGDRDGKRGGERDGERGRGAKDGWKDLVVSHLEDEISQLRQQIFTTLQERITARAGELGILGGDLNAAGPGGRSNYASSSRKFFAEVDAQLERFTRTSGGQMISADSVTRVGLRVGDSTAAKLDHLVYGG